MSSGKSIALIRSASLRISIALSALSLSVSALGDEATDASTAEQDAGQLQEVVVTGTLIRGLAPIGSNMISTSREEVTATGASTTDQLLATIPQVVNLFNGLPQITAGTGISLQVIRPNLRNTPSDSTATGASTLILVDGHRIASAGITQTAPDPEAVPPGAIERVEIVTDGGSSIYGADAIGGVINFITRRKFSGIEANARQGWTAEYKNFDTNLTAGTDLGQGSVYVSFNYARHDALFGRDRSYVKSIDWATGVPAGRQCNPANVLAGGSSYAVPGLVPNTFNACDPSDDVAIYPEEAHHSVFVGLSQDFSESLKFDLRSFYTTHDSVGVVGPSRATVTVAPGSYYYQPLPAPNAGAAQSVQFDFSPVLGNASSRTDNRIKEWGVTPTVTFDLSSDWQIRGMFNYGDTKTSFRLSDVNPTLVSQYAAGTTAATAINPYDIAATTDSALISNLLNYEQTGESRDKITNVRAIADGALFSIPGGKVRIAAGAEYLNDAFEVRQTQGLIGALNSVPFSNYSRNVKSVFGELQVPIVGASNTMPGLHALDLSVTGRYDKYSDFGSTTNPKFGLSYEPVSWITLRGNWGKSFNAPTPIDQLGAQGNSLAGFNFYFVTPPGQVPPAIGTAVALVMNGASNHLQPQTAKTYSFGFDIEPPVVPGLRTSLSFYRIDYEGTLGKPQVFNAPLLFAVYPQYVTQHPTLAQIQAFAAQAAVIGPSALPYLGANPPLPVYQLVDFRTYNLGNTKLSGLDFSAGYTHATGFGSIDGRVSGNAQLTHETQISSGAPFVDDLLTNQSTLALSASLGATIHNLRGQVTLNHTGGYDVVETSTLLQNHVGSFDVVNLFFLYTVNGKGLWRDLDFTLNVDNVLNRDPPVYKQPAGIGQSYGYANGATLGRLFQVGISKKF